MTFVYGPSGREVPFVQKIREINWFLVIVVTAIAVMGFAMLYSTATGPVGADGQAPERGSFDPWASRQMARYAFGVFAMLAIGLVDIRRCSNDRHGTQYDRRGDRFLHGRRTDSSKAVPKDRRG